MNSRQVKIWFGSDGPSLSIRIVGSDHPTPYTGDRRLAEELPSLPDAISSDTPVEQIAVQYQEFFRGLRSGTVSAPGPNAMEQIFLHIGDQASGTVELRFESSDDCLWACGRPWELLLHDVQRDQLQDRLLRVAAVRSTGATKDYSPRRIDAKLRVLVLQGADGPQPLDFAGERAAIETAWNALGPTLQAYVDQPVIEPAFRDRIASTMAKVRPHLLWFSGHGQPSGNDFNLLLGHGNQGDWVSASVFRDALVEAAHQTGTFPIIAAFWACEAGRAPNPSLDAGDRSFPVLVKSIVEAGVEAVIGVQTKIYNTSARIMGTELFRCLAEGFGPAQSLASARAKLLAIPRSRTAPGRPSEWTSPIMWVNGANLPAIEWGRSFDKDEALAFYRLGTESFLLFEGGLDVLQETSDPSAASKALAWVKEAPMWVTCPNLHLTDIHLAVIRRLRSLALSENKTVLVIHFNSFMHNTLLDAVADGFAKLQLRTYPKPHNEGWDFLASLFEAFRSRPKERGWPELLSRPDMILAIIADGGLPPGDELRDARSAAAALLVFSGRKAEDPNEGGALWDGWHADDFDCDGNTDMSNDEALNGFLTAFATLNKPLSEVAIAELARDFDLSLDDSRRDQYLAPLGQRYVVKASVAQTVLGAASADQKRAAHRACLGLLARLENEFDAPSSQQLVWRVQHALQADEMEEAVELASRAIRQLANQGNHQDVAELFKRLGAAKRNLDLSSSLSVADALIHIGNPRRAYDLLQQKPIPSSASAADKLRFAVVKAEALRNMPEPNREDESISTLEAAVDENASASLTTKDDERWLLIAEHDLGRNIHYFRKQTPEACAIFRRVIAECSEDPEFAYLKVAALRNLADALDRYTYDKVERDPEAAKQCIRDAVAVARKFQSAAPLLPEMLYVLANYEYAETPGAAGTDIAQAIELARDRGIGLVLALAKNKKFWWKVGPLTVENLRPGFDSREWSRLEKELDLLVGHAWPLRALIDSRIRAARCLSLLGRTVEAAEILKRARDLLVESPTLDGQGDWTHRWMPVFAGLAVLNQPAKQTDMWVELRTAASGVGVLKEIGAKSPQHVWEEVS